MTAPKRVLITGGGGFVGRRFVAVAAARGCELTVLERNADAADAFNRLGVSFVEHDVCEPLPTAVCRGFDAVVHLAAYVPPNLDDPSHAAACLGVNGIGTLNVLEAARSAGVAHFVYLGAANAYARGRRPARESDALTPTGKAAFYLTSKVVGEFFVEHCGRTGAMRCATLRASAVYGAGMPSHTMVFRFLSGLCRGEPVTVTDGGRYTVDLVHVGDVAGAIAVVLERGVVGPINIAGGRRYSSRQAASIAARACSAPRRLINVLPAVADSNPVEFPAIDIRRARAELDFDPCDLETGLRQMLAEDPRLVAEAK